MHDGAEPARHARTWPVALPAVLASVWMLHWAREVCIPILLIVIATGTALVAFLQFGTLGMAVLVGGISLLITSLERYLLTPWLTGRASRMNPVAVFVGVLLQPIGELLGD